MQKKKNSLYKLYVLYYFIILAFIIKKMNNITSEWL